MNGEHVLEQCKNANGFRILNHPFGPTPWVSFDFTSLDFEAVEIYNGSAGFDNSDMLALDFWEQSIVEKTKENFDITSFYLPIGSSDSHRWSTEAPGTILDPALGWPRTRIGFRAGSIQDFDSANVLALIEKGQVIVGDPSTKLSYFVHNSVTSEVVYNGETIQNIRTMN